MKAKQVEEMINTGLADAQVQVESSDGSHFAALVIATEFDGLGKIQRHQLVYRTLGELVGREIHALSIRAYSPEEWSALQAAQKG
jgi:acid stress-induced BolA-like protein IbaG/YrbA